jgi:hypothetical protein
LQPKQKQNLPNEEKTETAVDTGDRLIETRLCRRLKPKRFAAVRLPYAIIDGKQRLEAIVDFLEGESVLNTDFEFIEDPSLALGG